MHTSGGDMSGSASGGLRDEALNLPVTGRAVLNEPPDLVSALYKSLSCNIPGSPNTNDVPSPERRSRRCAAKPCVDGKRLPGT